MTLPIADSAEMAHMATVSPSSKAASAGRHDDRQRRYCSLK